MPPLPPPPSDTVRLDADAVRQANRATSHVTLLLRHRGGASAHPLQEGTELVIGRDSSADVVVDDPGLSRRHARFSFSGGRILVEDLGSTNQTRVGGAAIATATPLGAGDVVEAGGVFVYLQASADAPLLQGLLSHDRFVVAVQEEVARGRAFGRAFCVLAVRTPEATMGTAFSVLQRQLRAVDRLAVFGDHLFELLLPEMEGKEAEARAHSIVSAATELGPVVVAVATWPAAGAHADALLSAARATAAGGAPGVRFAATVQGQALAATGEGPVVESAAMRTLMGTVDRVARSAIPVLLIGETGSGKEVLAREIHHRSPRAKGPLVAVNCGAIPGGLVEGTLFGHDKGAFTGATERKAGVFEAADGGTLLLDEVGELPAGAQAALLRTLETRKVQRVGATAEKSVDVRVVAATHRDLDAMVQAGTFRQDLLFRLNAITLRVPSLRERSDEIPQLARRFVEEASLRHSVPPLPISEEALEVLVAWRWPGNVRELKNALERALVIAQGDAIEVDDLPDALRQVAAPAAIIAAQAPATTVTPQSVGTPAGLDASSSLTARVDAFEARCILDVLDATGHSIQETAERLQIPKRTLQYKMKIHGIIRQVGYTRG